MSDLADEAGDWREHLPYAAAAGFLEDAEYQQLYGEHVNGCQYCQQLIDALHPSEDTMANLLSGVEEMPRGSETWNDVADAISEARWHVDSIRDVLASYSHGVHPGTFRTWARAQQWLVHASQSLEVPATGAGAQVQVQVPWTATVALSLDTQPDPTSTEMRRDQFEDTVEEAVSLLLASRFRVAHAGDLQTGSLSERICDLAHHYGRRGVTTQAKHAPADLERLGFGVTEYCAWPVHISTPLDKVETYEANFGKLGIIQWLTLQGEPRPYSYFMETARRQPQADEWEQGLAALRNTMMHNSRGHIAIGGRTDIDRGAMPSLALDVLNSLRRQHPLFVLGGFGGCARELAAVMGLTDTQTGNHAKWSSFQEFTHYIGANNLHNGLDNSENRTLAETTDVEEAMQLVVLGMGRITSQLQNLS